MLAYVDPIRYAAGMAQPKILDLDAQLGIANEPVNTLPFRLFGREWTLLCDLNTFALSDLGTGDPAAVVRYMVSFVIDDERDDFRTALSSQPNMTVERLGEILTALTEAATERPTTPPSVSGPGRQSQTSPRKSAASTSRRPAAR